MVRSLIPAFRAFQRLAYRYGFDIQHFTPALHIPDAHLYAPYFQPWRSAEWHQTLRADDAASLVTPDRKYVLWKFARQCAKTLPGDFIECGVYAGGTAYLLADVLKSSDKTLHLFDTFEGMPETNADKDIHKKGDFSDTSLAAVKRYLSAFTNLDFHPGFIPDSFAALVDARFAFAHIDLDIYDAILASTEFLYDRMSPGGVIVFDDYGLPTCPGARDAVDTFFKNKSEEVIALQTGQAVVIRSTC